MRHQARITTLIFSIALLGTAVADDAAAPAPVGPNGPATDVSADWTQTHLQAKPALREQIDQTKAFLDDKETEMEGQLSHLKTEGLIDRRSTTKINSALDDARVSMTGMAEGMQSEQELDGWTARMIAYELGMAADTLTQQADKIETELGATPEGNNESQDDNSASPDQRQDLIATLRETSSLLRKAARAIVGNVK